MAGTGTRYFDFEAMQARKQEFFSFVRLQAKDYFNEDGTYKSHMDPDRRATYWIFPALIDTEDAGEREFALRLLSADPCWNSWNIFVTSSIASILVRERNQLPSELVQRAESHLDRFVDAGSETTGSSGSSDYMFQGYNDNMPAMATRALILAGEVLDRRDLLEHGLFFLETLCAHFQRRGLLAEYNSGTYIPITLTALMDVAECAENADAREMALACARRILLDIFCHWHAPLRAGSGSSSRAYIPDATVTYTGLGALLWYLGGDPLILTPMKALGNPPYDGPFGHGPHPGFSVSATCEFFTPAYREIGDDLVQFANQSREYPFDLRATMDAGRTANIQTRLHQQPQWALGTASREMWTAPKHHHLTLRGTFACKPQLESWKDRLSFWHQLQGGDTDLGDTVPAGYNNFTIKWMQIQDYGQYHTAQKNGTALVLGHLGSGAVGQEISQLRFSIIFSTFGRTPDEMAENDMPLPEWTGAATAEGWQFLRFGDVYIGLRVAGMLNESALPVRRLVKGGYLRLELPVLEGQPTRIDSDFRKWLDLGYVLEMGDAAECGSFAHFRQQCLATTWEYTHCFYRHSRYRGRHGELQIADSIDPEGLRFIAVDGALETPVQFEATGMDPRLIQLFPDGRVVRQRRMYWRRDTIGTPFYSHLKAQCLAADIPGMESGEY